MVNSTSSNNCYIRYAQKGRIWAWNAIGCAHTWYCYTTTHNCCTQTNYTLITVKLNITMMIVTLVMHLECCLQQIYIG